MIVLFRPPASSACDEIEDRLREAVLAHRIVVRKAEPVLTEGSNTYTGVDAIRAFLDDLERELALGRRFQSDACYLDPDHPGVCL